MRLISNLKNTVIIDCQVICIVQVTLLVKKNIQIYWIFDIFHCFLIFNIYGKMEHKLLHNAPSLDLSSIILFWKNSRKIDHVSWIDTELIWKLIFPTRASCWCCWCFAKTFFLFGYMKAYCHEQRRCYNEVVVPGGFQLCEGKDTFW
jgi:hypothetical protein